MGRLSFFRRVRQAIGLTGLAVLFLLPAPAQAETDIPAQLGPRPFYLLEQLEAGALKDRLEACKAGPFYRSDFSIAHRGAPLQFPEHTRQSYQAALTMGAGIVECDVTFTQDRELVCRHSQCDLQATTDILLKPELAGKCTQPFQPADPATGAAASAKCCTSDITLAEFRTLKGKMDGVNKQATTPEEYVRGTADWRTDLYSATGTLMTHGESLNLIDRAGAKFTPELKAPQISMPFDGDFSQQDYARKLVEDYKARNIDPSRVYLQSFNLEDIRFWIETEPDFGRQAVYLDGRSKQIRPDDPNSFSPSMQALADMGLKIIAPPIWMLLSLDDTGEIIPSLYARKAREAGLDIIAWSLERSGPLTNGGGWYYKTVKPAIRSDGDMLKVLDILARDVGVIGVFSDWPATTTFYANCTDKN
ncbi:glycerophosphodiester phosphodiesterase family protein [Sneathiella chinensis]|uniref:glycerophosphodiester phosphodiesterase n=1 Tax=Sneathiella chinensis TaxID=349750 RepID=A0ABQ5U9N4_9PROT|nr:glycerophosphodiester phosphodiesterase family protein [Sneathiella chinensis]GLQ07893.1 glycerophosphoryl diester phosphodiesterase [Sneathiella chinensis]